MKKLFFSVILALVLIVSGLTAVAAYEGHVVDVKAHVENAIAVNTNDFDFGTAFPQQLREGDIYVGVTESFTAQNLVYSTVTYKLYWEPKPAEGEICNPVVIDNADYYQNIYPYVALKIDGTDQAAPFTTVFGLQAGSGDLSSPDDECDTIHFKFLAPVFEGFVYPSTDPGDISGVISANNYCLEPETICGTYAVMVPHIDLGNNLIIQVTGFGLHVN
jgi:hypothetical protein